MADEYRFEVYTEYSDYGDKEYVVKYCDLENVIGVGETIALAISAAEENLNYFLNYCKEHGIDVPEPTKHEENEYSGKVTLRMSKGLHKRVDERAKKEGVSVNLLLNEAIASYISYQECADKIVTESAEKISEIVQKMANMEYSYPSFNEQITNSYCSNIQNTDYKC